MGARMPVKCRQLKRNLFQFCRPWALVTKTKYEHAAHTANHTDVFLAPNDKTLHTVTGRTVQVMCRPHMDLLLPLGAAAASKQEI